MLCNCLLSFIKIESNTLGDICPAKLICDFIILTCWHVASASSKAHQYVIFYIFLLHLSDVPLPSSAVFYPNTKVYVSVEFHTAGIGNILKLSGKYFYG
jgi:hypothetical protein